MRISNSNFYKNSLELLQSKKSELVKTQEQISTGKQITKSGDDPTSFLLAMDLTKEIDQTEQYQRNIVFGRVQLNLSETAMTQQTEDIGEIKETMVALMGGLRNDADVQSIKKTLETKLEDLKSLANTRDSFGNYVFAGAKQNLPAYDTTTNTYQGSFGATPTDADKRTVKVSKASSVDLNLNGKKAFQVTGSPNYENVLQVVQGVINKLSTSNPQDLANALAEEFSLLDNALDNSLSVRTEIGEAQLKMDESELSNAKQILDLRASREEAVGVDLAEAISSFTFQQTQFQALQQSYVTLAKKSLFDFIA